MAFIFDLENKTFTDNSQLIEIGDLMKKYIMSREKLLKLSFSLSYQNCKKSYQVFYIIILEIISRVDKNCTFTQKILLMN